MIRIVEEGCHIWHSKHTVGVHRIHGRRVVGRNDRIHVVLHRIDIVPRIGGAIVGRVGVDVGHLSITLVQIRHNLQRIGAITGVERSVVTGEIHHRHNTRGLSVRQNLRIVNTVHRGGTGCIGDFPIWEIHINTCRLVGGTLCGNVHYLQRIVVSSCDGRRGYVHGSGEITACIKCLGITDIAAVELPLGRER